MTRRIGNLVFIIFSFGMLVAIFRLNNDMDLAVQGMFIGLIFPPLIVFLTRVALEWEIMLFDWIVAATKAHKISIEEYETKRK